MRLLTLHCFFLTLITVFPYVQCHICLYALSVNTIFSFCVFIFTFFFILFSPQDRFYNLPCLIRFHYNLPVIGDKKYFIAQYVALIITNPILFLIRIQIKKSFLSSFLMNIPSINFYNYLVIKRSLNNTPYRKFSLHCKTFQNKKRTCLN